ncbi:MAG: hypothetical protein EOO73_27730, partial [Myxococcales bacterium]
MKRLLEERDASLSALTELVASAERHVPSPFAKRAMESRISRALAAPSRRSLALRPAFIGAAALFVAATAAAAGYSFLGSSPPSESAPIAPPATVVVP